LGKGGFGVVFKAMRKKDEKIVALKALTARGMITEEMIQAEVGLMLLVQDECESILRCYETYKWGTRYYLVVEFMDFSVRNLIDYQQKVITEGIIRYICGAVLKGLAAMHKKKIMHRDIKSDNILINKEG